MTRSRTSPQRARKARRAASPRPRGDTGLHRYRSSFEHAAVGIAHTATDGRILEVNQSLCRLLGYSADALRGRLMGDLNHPGDRGSQTALRLELVAGKRAKYSGEKRYLRKDGSVVWVYRTVALARGAGDVEPFLIQTIEDITERKRTQEWFQRLERARRVLAECGHAQAHAANESGLLAEICCIAVESGGYRQAWIGVPTGESARSVEPVAHAGYDSSEPMKSDSNWAPDGRYQGLAGEAVARGELRIVRDILNDPRHAAKRDRALELGYQSSIALPLRSEDAVVGVLVLHASESDAFDADEIALLSGLADEVAFGIAAQRAQVARQQAEQGLRESEQQVREVFDQAAVGIIRADLNGVLVEVNRKFCEMLGHARHELLGRTIRDITHPDDYGEGAKVREELQSGMQVPPRSGEKRFQRRDGTSLWTKRTLSASYDDAGRPKYVTAVIEDITQQKELELRYRDTFDQAAVGIVHNALDGTYIRVNRKFCEMLGYAEHELIGRNADLITHPEDLEQSRANRRALMDGRQATQSGEKRYIRKDGTVIWVRRTASLARDESGAPMYVIRVIEDITDRKEAEERYRAAFDNAPVGIMHTAVADDRILDANPKLCEMTGYDRSELLGLATDDLIPADFAGVDRHKYREQMLRGDIGVYSSERKFRRKDGTNFWINRTVSIARGVSGEPLYFIRIVEDITARKAAEERYRATFDNAPVGIMHTSLDGYRILEANHKLCEMLGYARDELLGMTSTHVVHPDYRYTDLAHYRGQLLAGAIQSFASERIFVRKDGSTLWVNRTVSLVRDAAGQPEYYIRVIEDISQRKAAEEAVARERVLLRTVVDALPDRIYAKDRDGYFLLQNATNVQAHGVAAAEELLGKTVYDIFPPDVARRVDAEDRSIIDSGQPLLNRERASTDASGNTRWVVASKVPFRDPEGRVMGIVGVNRDITEYKRMEEALRQNVERFENLAHYDVLTGLPNRVLFYDRLKQALAHARRNQWNVGVLFIDVDRFKNVNDTLGHAVGDQLLQQVSERLARAVRADDTVGRLGGDEFAIVLSNLTSAQDANPVAQKIMASFNEPFRLGGAEVFVTGSIGITLFPDDSTDQDTLIKNADAAMYRAKELGRNGYQFYTPEMNARALELLGMESSLRRALERAELQVHFQPKANVASGEIVGLEALLRWNHPERGMVPPSAFIPVMEETGLIVAAGEWVLDAVCGQIAAWRKAGLKPLPVAVNLSARQFLSKDLGPAIQRIIEANGVEPGLIELEITESSLMANTTEAITTLEFLSRLGLLVALDDFGTGYSSLSYLKRFPLDAIKIDRSFVRDITTDEDDANITRAIISMAHSLGLKVIAEGVETEAQAAFLADHGCDEIQGYYLTPPLAPDDCVAWLAARGAPGRLAAGGDSRPSVLLVDDEEIALVLARRALGKDGYQVHTAKNAHDAFKLLGEHRVDVIISDHHMPGTSGIEFLARVKSRFPHVVRIMLSGSPDQSTAEEAVTRAGVFRFLPKGVSDELLRAEVCEALRTRALTRAAAPGGPPR